MNDIILLRAFITPGLHTLSITSRIPIPDVFPIVTDLESDELYANTMGEICEVASGLRKLSLHQFCLRVHCCVWSQLGTCSMGLA